jgi:hypothetical protein
MSDYRPAHDIVPSVPAPHATRYLATRVGAETMARDLDAWWGTRGYTNVRRRVEWLALAHTSGKRSDQLGRSPGAWVIRSNLINAIPPREGH